MKKATLPQHEVEVQERDNELPEGWATATLGQIAEQIQYGYTASAIQAKGPRLLRITDIQNGKVDWESVPSCEISKDDAEKYSLKEGDIVFARTGATTGKSFLIGSCPQAVFASYLIRVRGHQLVNSAFLIQAFNTPQYWAFIMDNVAGNAQPNCNASKLAALTVPVAPAAEQERLVSTVKELSATVDKSRTRLGNVPKILKAFRQSVLAAACSGRLTEDWREEHPEIGPACELLEIIAKERTKLKSRRAESTEETQGWMPNEERELPSSWVWAKLNDLLDYERAAGYGVLQPGSEVPDGIPMVRVCDVDNGKVNVAALKRIAPEIARQYSRTVLKGGEVLVTLVGTIGRVAVATASARGANVARAIGMFPLCPYVAPRFVEFMLSEPVKNSQLVDLAREVARKTLNLGILKAVQIPLAPVSEQHEIVRRVEALFKLADQIEKRVEAATKRADKLTQSILAKAFRGELVPTEAELARKEGRTYEPASELLARIHADRERTAATKPTSTNRKSHPTPATKR